MTTTPPRILSLIPAAAGLTEPRLDAYEAARTARFEHGEQG
jgi:hypothetical protein